MVLPIHGSPTCTATIALLDIYEFTGKVSKISPRGAIVNAKGALNPMVDAGIGEEDHDRTGALNGIDGAGWRNTQNVDAIGTRQRVIRKGHRLLNRDVTGMGRSRLCRRSTVSAPNDGAWVKRGTPDDAPITDSGEIRGSEHPMAAGTPR